ncbi:uncharacterized protein YbjT (DUF2867 family) [Actinoplanes campanulatus]|uniref:Uncharacterized protein YbjT (DUF2867 family) n=1 Tax=Actinoplanes campanulatus TaxID=113559 RepID=A0A7W5AMQ4_9ACTN|nr:NAD(P)H-binding protein [Actinoplanes campanulatus]MBB3099138.1 uncharacterized protein YbjT (DUF2867 family) [Actinoplanes campanulatus]GGN38858.1 nucleotide-diphosphate-sugar epimerase [Actinoplanes campanulatus]GID40294.1 nucleotide-diphosphate-sugar epimerase [Actinoplanes campanulatus]
MFAVTGITGRVGGAAAQALLAAGAPVRAVVRNPASAHPGGEVAVSDLSDRTGLSTAFSGCRGVFVMLPFTGGAEPTMIEAIAAAVADSGVSHVVMLSSTGADLPDGTGPIRWLHHLEQALHATGARLTAIRSPHFQEKALETGAVESGVYPVFADSADVPLPMAATVDVGAAAARALLTPPAASEVVDLEAPAYTERQVAEILGKLLGRELTVVTVPQPAWRGALADAGLPPELASELAALYDADNRGILRPCGDRRVRCTTELEQTLRDLLTR